MSHPSFSSDFFKSFRLVSTSLLLRHAIPSDRNDTRCRYDIFSWDFFLFLFFILFRDSGNSIRLISNREPYARKPGEPTRIRRDRPGWVPRFNPCRRGPQRFVDRSVRRTHPPHPGWRGERERRQVLHRRERNSTASRRRIRFPGWVLSGLPVQRESGGRRGSDQDSSIARADPADPIWATPFQTASSATRTTGERRSPSKCAPLESSARSRATTGPTISP